MVYIIFQPCSLSNLLQCLLYRIQKPFSLSIAVHNTVKCFNHKGLHHCYPSIHLSRLKCSLHVHSCAFKFLRSTRNCSESMSAARMTLYTNLVYVRDLPCYGHIQNVIGVSLPLLHTLARAEVPQSHGAIKTRGEDKGTRGRAVQPGHTCLGVVTSGCH